MVVKDELVDGIRRLTIEFSTLLDVALTPTSTSEMSPHDNEAKRGSSSADSETDSYSTESEMENKFPTIDDNLQPCYQSAMPLSDADGYAIQTIKLTADIAEELIWECDDEMRNHHKKVIEEYKQSVNDLIRRYETVAVNINCDRCRRQFCSSIKDLEGALQQLFTKCSTVGNPRTDLIERFRNSTVESSKILSRLEAKIRYYNEKESRGERSNSTNSEDSVSGLNNTMELLRSFYGALTYVTGIVTMMLETNPEPDVSDYLKQRSTELGRSTSKMIIYIEARLLYNYLMNKLGHIERVAEELKTCRLYQLTELLKIMAKEAKDLTLTFKRLVNHFDMKRGSKTSGELIRSSFSLEKLAKTFVFNIKKTEFLINAKYNYGKGQLKIGYVKEFTGKAKVILNLFLMEINKIVKATT